MKKWVKWVVFIVSILCTVVAACLWCCRTDKTDPENYAELRTRYWTRIKKANGTTWEVSEKVNEEKEIFETLSNDAKIRVYEDAEETLK